jgi:hypothetical protein
MPTRISVVKVGSRMESPGCGGRPQDNPDSSIDVARINVHIQTEFFDGKTVCWMWMVYEQEGGQAPL